MATTEHTINDALAERLRATRHIWNSLGVVSSETTNMLADTNGRPDILIIEPNVSPVVIETEVLPAITVESEAVSRLGARLTGSHRKILSSIAVRLPKSLRTKTGAELRDELGSCNFDLAFYTGTNPTSFTRWPQSGWISGDIYDLSIIAQSASLPPTVIEAAADQLVDGVRSAASMMNEMAVNQPAAIHKISMELHQEDSEQTRRMASTILANAFLFHETLSGGPGDLATVLSLEELRGNNRGLNKETLLTEWRKILQVNYWPIFDIARRIMEIIPAINSGELIDGLAHTAFRLLESRLMRSHDLTGAVFQKLIADRKFLAAYYTTPASAAMLVGLAITEQNPPVGGSWSSKGDITQLRVADFACGTGTLLSTAYQRITQLHELAGGDAAMIHPEMMATGLVGCDVLPAAAHLTASMLSGAQPTVTYKASSIMTVPYGTYEDEVVLGSLDLLRAQGAFDVLTPATSAKVSEGTGETTKDPWLTLPHATFDLVIMNPPFTRATGHEGAKVGVHNPMFAAFSMSEEGQRAMAKATRVLTAGTSAKGNAGEASIFLVLADRKLKIDGTLALVMPLSLMSGEAWEESRELLAKNYRNLILVTIAGGGSTDMSFSADTGMGECLIVGRKNNVGSERAVFIVLNERPPYPLQGASAAREINRILTTGSIRRLEDGPVGGNRITFGGEVIGHVIDAPIPASGGWNLVRIADLSLAQTAYQMTQERRVWLPGMNSSEAIQISLTTVAAVGEIGPYHMDVCGTATGGIRGPFSIHAVQRDSAPTYPVLWSHEADMERTLAFPADSECIPLRGANPEDRSTIERKVASVWASASHCHFNRDFQFNSQSTAMQFTNRPTIGGRAWLSIKLKSSEQEKVLVAWANTSLGILLHWWHANKQQAGRGSIGKAALENLPILDISTLSQQQITAGVKVFDQMSAVNLLPIHKIELDTSRHELDREFLQHIIGLPAGIFASGGPIELLRMKIAREPSISGKPQ